MSSYSNMYSVLCCNPDTCRGATGRSLVALLVPPTGGRSTLSLVRYLNECSSQVFMTGEGSESSSTGTVETANTLGDRPVSPPSRRCCLFRRTPPNSAVSSHESRCTYVHHPVVFEPCPKTIRLRRLGLAECSCSPRSVWNAAAAPARVNCRLESLFPLFIISGGQIVTFTVTCAQLLVHLFSPDGIGN